MFHISSKSLLLLSLISFFSVSCGSKTVYQGFNSGDGPDSSILDGDGINADSDDAVAKRDSNNDDPSGQDDKVNGDNDVVVVINEAKIEEDPNSNGNNTDSDSDNKDNVLLGTPECISAETTRSKLLTETISREITQKELRYEIYALDCLGKAIEPSHLDFDFNYVVNKVDTINYKILNPQTNEVVLSGPLQSISGEDLFGNKGDELFHYKTDKKIEFGTNPKLILAIDVSEIEFIEPQGPNDYDQLPTYLKIGQYEPHKENVKLLEEGCISQQESRVGVLTDGLDVRLDTPASISLEYQLYSKDCMGMPIEADEILFDLNYRFDLSDSGENSVSYTIIEEESGQTVSTGSLILIRGEDLFGNSGNHFFYYKTDGDFDFPAEWNKLKLIISWQDVVFKSPTSEDADSSILPSFIKFGQDLEPTKKDINLNLLP